MNKNKQCAYWFLTIHENAVCYSNIETILKDQEIENPNLEYSYIYHDNDIECDMKHIHIVLYFKGKVKRFSTIFNMFEGSHIEQTNQQRYKRCIQYLIHKNHPERKQYLQSDIVSNIGIELIADILNGDGYDFEYFYAEKIYDYMNEFGVDITMAQFVQRFGLDAIKGYYFIIKDMIKEYNDTLTKMKIRQNKKTTMDKAFDIYSKDAKKEWQLAKYHFNYKGDLADYINEMYLDFVDSVERGLINVNDIIEKGVY